MNLYPQSLIPAAPIEPAGNQQMQEKQGVALEDKILSEQTDQAHERDDSGPPFIP